MPSPAPRIALFARYPVPGKVNTRLIPLLGEEGAARLHRRLTERTLAAIRSSGLPFVVRVTGAPIGDFAAWLGEGVRIEEQGGGDLGERLARVPAPAILLGADIPELEPRHLVAAAEALREVPLAIGPARDGGYYCLALREPVPFLFAGMKWGTDSVARETMARLDERGMRYAVLDELDDCDRPEDLARWPWLLE